MSIQCAFHQLVFHESQGHILACLVLATLLSSPLLDAACLGSTPCWRLEVRLLSKRYHCTQSTFKSLHQLAFFDRIWRVYLHQCRIWEEFQELAALHQATSAIRDFLARFCRHLEFLSRANPFASRARDTKLVPCRLGCQIRCLSQRVLLWEHPYHCEATYHHLLLNFTRKDLLSLLIVQQSVRKRCLAAVKLPLVIVCLRDYW